MKRDSNFYQDYLNQMLPRISKLLEQGYTIELAQSRSGVKLIKTVRFYENINNPNNTGRC